MIGFKKLSVCRSKWCCVDVEEQRSRDVSLLGNATRSAHHSSYGVHHRHERTPFPGSQYSILCRCVSAAEFLHALSPFSILERQKRTAVWVDTRVLRPDCRIMPRSPCARYPTALVELMELTHACGCETANLCYSSKASLAHVVSLKGPAL